MNSQRDLRKKSKAFSNVVELNDIAERKDGIFEIQYKRIPNQEIISELKRKAKNKLIKFKQNIAARKIQSFYKKYIRIKLHSIKVASRKIFNSVMQWYRKKKTKKIIKRYMNHCASMIQRSYRKYIMRIKLKEIYNRQTNAKSHIHDKEKLQVDNTINEKLSFEFDAEEHSKFNKRTRIMDISESLSKISNESSYENECEDLTRCYFENIIKELTKSPKEMVIKAARNMKYGV